MLFELLLDNVNLSCLYPAFRYAVVPPCLFEYSVTYQSFRALFQGGDKPYLISGGDDRLIKIWDYQVRIYSFFFKQNGIFYFFYSFLAYCHQIVNVPFVFGEISSFNCGLRTIYPYSTLVSLIILPIIMIFSPASAFIFF